MKTQNTFSFAECLFDTSYHPDGDITDYNILLAIQSIAIPVKTRTIKIISGLKHRTTADGIYSAHKYEKS